MKAPSRRLIDAIRRIADDSVCQAHDDAVLLDQFVNNHDEAAFEVLLRRYEPMVAGVCRRLLPNPLEAQDAVQITFLALVCRAKDLHVSGRGIGGWLYQVAIRSARKMRDANRRAALREKAVARPESVVDPAPSCQTIEAMIYEELGLLPEKYRLALVMCCILNRSLADAGAEIGISAPAMWKRVQKGREILRKRLVWRGFEVTTGTVAVVLAATTAAEAVAPSAIPSVTALFGCQSARLGAIAEETAVATGGRHLAGWSLGFAVVGLVGVLVAAVSWAKPDDHPDTNHPLVSNTVPTAVGAVPVEAKPLVTARPPLAELTGVVRDGENRPVPFARITVLARTSKFGESSICDDVIAQAQTDDEGRYRVAVPHFRANPAEDRTLKVVAAAADSPIRGSAIRLVTVRSGVAIGTRDLSPAKPGFTTAPIEPVDLALQPSGKAIGRVVDGANRPVVGAEIRVVDVDDLRMSPPAGKASDRVECWPEPVRSNGEGQFEIVGLPPGRKIRIAIDHPEHAYRIVEIPVGSKPTTEPEYRLDPARRLVGRITSNGQPVPFARLIVVAFPNNDEAVGLKFSRITRNVCADAEGRFAVSAPRGSKPQVGVWVHPANAQLGILSTDRILEWPFDQPEMKLDLDLPVGEVLRGRVIDDDHRPVSHAQVQFHTVPATRKVLGGTSCSAWTDGDGQYALAVPRGEIRVAVTAAWDSYLPNPSEPDWIKYTAAGPISRFPCFEHGSRCMDVGSPSQSTNLEFQLQRGKTLVGSVVGIDGKPLASGVAICSHLNDGQKLAPQPVRDGYFEIPNCRKGNTYTVAVLSTDQKFGGIGRLDFDGLPTKPIRVDHTGRAIGRFQTPEGDRVVGGKAHVALVLDVDGPIGKQSSKPPAILTYDLAFGLPRESSGITNSNGSVEFGGLIPGVQHAMKLSHGDRSAFTGFVVLRRQTAVVATCVDAKPSSTFITP